MTVDPRLREAVNLTVGWLTQLSALDAPKADEVWMRSVLVQLGVDAARYRDRLQAALREAGVPPPTEPEVGL